MQNVYYTLCTIPNILSENMNFLCKLAAKSFQLIRCFELHTLVVQVDSESEFWKSTLNRLSRFSVDSKSTLQTEI